MVSHKNWKKPEKGRQSWSGPFRTKMRPSRKTEEQEDVPDEEVSG
jgi:hypothetical protein